MDLCGEIPYENLNGMINPAVPHGRGRTIKGAFYSKFESATLKKMFELISATSSGEHETIFIIEYHSVSKLLSVPANETAFVRKDAGNIIFIDSWKTDTPENTTIGRANTKELSNIVVESQRALVGDNNQGYGNYGKLSRTFLRAQVTDTGSR